MKRTKCCIALLTCAMTCSITTGVLRAQSFDNTGNGLASGNYFVRWVALDNETNAGTAGRARAFTGSVNFNGSGNYSITGQLSDNTISGGTPQSFSFNGSYSVAQSGLLRMQNPFSTSDLLFGGFGNSAFVASSTESQIFDMMVGVPVSGTVSNSALSGKYAVGSIAYPTGDITQANNTLFTVQADGNGNLGTISVLSHAANAGDTDMTASLSGSTYSLTGAGTSTSNTLNFTGSSLVSGTKQFGVSTDGKVFVGGGSNTYDMIIGVRTPGTGLSNSTMSGVYFTGGMDVDNSDAIDQNYYFDAYYGSSDLTGTGTLIAHQRVNPSDNYTYDYTFDDQFTVPSNGFVDEGPVNGYLARFYVGEGGQARLLVGESTLYTLELDVQAKVFPQSPSVYLNPLGVVNSANYVPITNPVAPGEYVNLYGTNLSSTTAVATSTPFPTTLGNTQVKINGNSVRLYSVSPTQIVCLVPYGLTAAYAQFQVVNNGTNSNTVTMFTELSAPGMFTQHQNGIGDGAITHANGSLVTPQNPGMVGETLVAYATGLGTVTPTVGDGQVAPSNNLSQTDDNITIYVDGQPATTNFVGLTPGDVSLYQLNFVVPSIPDSGEVYVDISDGDSGAYSSMASADISGGGPVSSRKPSVRMNAVKHAGLAAKNKGIKTKASLRQKKSER